MKRPVTYYRELKDYKNVISHGWITEVVVFYVPALVYKYHVFVLYNGKQVKKLYRKSLLGAKKQADKLLRLDRDDGRNFLNGEKCCFVFIDGKKVVLPSFMEIPVKNAEI